MTDDLIVPILYILSPSPTAPYQGRWELTLAHKLTRTWKFVQEKSKQTMKLLLGIRDEKTFMKVTPPLAVAPITQEDVLMTCIDDMRWNDGTRNPNKSES